jgi:hypothetical protein
MAIDFPVHPTERRAMQVEELKAVVDRASEEERLVLAAYLHLKTSGGQGLLGIELAEARKRMEAGHAVSLEKAWELHRQLETSGL